MNQKEFRDWFRNHRASFASLDAWISKMPTNQKKLAGQEDDRITQAEVAAAWFNALADLPLGPCKEATSRLVRGEDAVPPSYDGHPLAVRRIAKAIMARSSGGKPEPFGPKQIRSEDGRFWEDTFKCPICRDEGLVTLIHEKSIEHFRNGVYFTEGVDRQGNPSKGRRLMSCIVRCTCSAGERRPQSVGRAYDGDRDLIFDCGNDERNDTAIEQFVEREQGVF